MQKKLLFVGILKVNDENSSRIRIRIHWSGSIGLRHGSIGLRHGSGEPDPDPDPDPYEMVMDLQHYSAQYCT